MAVQRWSQDDPQSAAAYAAALPPGRRQQDLLRAVAQGYAQSDPDGALAWFDTLAYPPQGLLANLLTGVAQADPERALELMFDNELQAGRNGSMMFSAMSMVAAAASRSSTLSMTAIADRALALEDQGQRQMGLQVLLDTWAAKMPTPLSIGWLEMAALARYDPARAAALLSSISGGQRNELTATAAAIGSSWVRRDPQAARLWIASLVEGPIRDAALSGMLGAGVDARMPDPSLLALFSSAGTRQEALLPVILRVAQRDRAEARGLLEQHVTDPALRMRGEQWLERLETGETGFSAGQSGIVIRN